MKSLKLSLLLSIIFMSYAAVAAKKKPVAPAVPPAPVTARISVQGVTHQGAGCPEATVSTSITDDVGVFSIIYSALQVELPPGSPVLDVWSKCWTTISMNLPANTQLLIESVDYAGFYSLSDDSIYARYNTKFFFENGAAYFANNYYRSWGFPGGLAKLVQGPVTENFQWHSDMGGIKQFTPCGGTTKLNIINSVSLTAAKPSSGGAGFDTMDTQLVHTYKAKLVGCGFKFKPWPDNPYQITNPASEHVGGLLWKEK